MIHETLTAFISSIEMKDNRERRERIIEQLERMNCNYEIQIYPFESTEEKGRNIIVRLGDSEKKIIVGAHYDVALGSGGANDNGSGISILLKFIQNFIKGSIKFSHSIEVIFFDHEETPESGAKYYVNNCHKENIKGMFNLDICGMGDTIIFDDKGKSNNSIVQAVIQATEYHQHNYTLLRELPASDERQFDDVGIPNIQLAAIPKVDIQLVTKLVGAQKELRDALVNGDITPREADEEIKKVLGKVSLPKLLKVMHTPDDLSIHLSEKTLMMVLNIITEALSRYDKM
jgi:Zn-dependent M28 family amino/carboxypeptidase